MYSGARQLSTLLVPPFLGYVYVQGRDGLLASSFISALGPAPASSNILTSASLAMAACARTAYLAYFHHPKVALTGAPASMSCWVHFACPFSHAAHATESHQAAED